MIPQARLPTVIASSAFAILAAFFVLADAINVSAQTVDDGSDAAIGKPDVRIVLDLIKQDLEEKATTAKVTELRRRRGTIICGSVNVTNKDGLYLGERGFIIDLAARTFGRVPEGPELLNPRAAGFEEKEHIRAAYFEMCLD